MSKVFIGLLLLSCCAVAQSKSGPNALFSNPQQPAVVSQACLPEGIKLDDVVTVREQKKITVGKTLKSLGAKCRGKKELVAASGRPITFYRMQGCWGNPPENYRQIMAEQERKLKELEKTNEVVRMTCNPTGGEIQ